MVGTAPRKQAGERKSLTRLETVRQVFFAFTNRMDAYDYKTSIGLVTFGSEVTVACAVTPFFDSFREKIDGVGATGDTKLYDAIALRPTSSRRSARATPAASTSACSLRRR